MLIISGTAQSTVDSDQYHKDDKHLITLFSQDENFEDQLDNIETYLNDLGWDNIVIEQTEVIDNSDVFDHQVLKDAYEKANQQKFAVVVNNVPLVQATSEA